MDIRSYNPTADEPPVNDNHQAGADDAGDGGATVPEDGTQGVEEAIPSAEELIDLRARAAELDQLRERVLRNQADFENSRKRLEREAATSCRFAIQEFVRELLPVLDNLDRAIEQGQASDAVALLDGVRLIQRQLYDVLQAHGVRPIESLGRKFDPEAHEAVAMQPSPEKEPFTVIEDVRRGFRMHDRVIRPAQVIVATGPQPDDEQRDSKPAPDEA